MAGVEASAPDSGSLELFDENGVDLSVVRYTLSLTPTERLQAIENFMNAMTTARRLPSPDEDVGPAADDER